ncbi:MAG: polysaccharide deacetylase family protein [Candidatus Kapabacteria bacterium]|nr:polysaccharide deacetylase family protein [Candidatus Kapabacteria bacterium]
MAQTGNKIALSIDVEDWYHTPLVTGASFSKYKTLEEFFSEWEGKYDTITEPTLKILDLLKKYNIKATFFVVANVVQNYPEIVEALKNSPHEIGCHSLNHYSAIDSKTKQPLQSLEDWTKELIEAKSILENTFQREVIGYRAPGAYFGRWMIPVLEKLGFKYDSSIAYNSLYNKTDTVLIDIPTTPYRINSETLGAENPDSNLIELPWANVRLFGKNIPAGGAYFFRLMGYNFYKYAIRKNLENGDTMFYFHPIDCTDAEIPLSNFKSRPFYWINKGTKTLRKIEKLFRYFDGRFTPCSEIYEKYILKQDVQFSQIR